MAADVTPNHDSQWAAMGAVAQMLGVGTAETVSGHAGAVQRADRRASLPE